MRKVIDARAHPPYAQKTKARRGWGTQFHPAWVGFAGGGLIRNKNVTSTARIASDCCAPPIHRAQDARWGTTSSPVGRLRRWDTEQNHQEFAKLILVAKLLCEMPVIRSSSTSSGEPGAILRAKCAPELDISGKWSSERVLGCHASGDGQCM